MTNTETGKQIRKARLARKLSVAAAVRMARTAGLNISVATWRERERGKGSNSTLASPEKLLALLAKPETPPGATPLERVVATRAQQLELFRAWGQDITRAREARGLTRAELATLWLPLRSPITRRRASKETSDLETTTLYLRSIETGHTAPPESLWTLLGLPAQAARLRGDGTRLGREALRFPARPDLSTSEVALRLEVSVPTLRRYLRGQNRPDRPWIVGACVLLGLEFAQHEKVLADFADRHRAYLATKGA